MNHEACIKEVGSKLPADFLAQEGGLATCAIRLIIDGNTGNRRMSKNKVSQGRYQNNRQAKIGDQCVCPSCRTRFIKESYHQVFCKSKPGTQCKDKYWNTVTPCKRNNSTRISPASERWLKKNRRTDHFAAEDGFLLRHRNPEEVAEWDEEF